MITKELESKLENYLKLEDKISKEVGKHFNIFSDWTPGSLLEKFAKIEQNKILSLEESKQKIKQSLSLAEEFSLRIEIEARILKNTQKTKFIEISQQIASVIFIISGTLVYIVPENAALPFLVATISILYAVGTLKYLERIDKINAVYRELID